MPPPDATGPAPASEVLRPAPHLVIRPPPVPPGLREDRPGDRTTALPSRKFGEDDIVDTPLGEQRDPGATLRPPELDSGGLSLDVLRPPRCQPPEVVQLVSGMTLRGQSVPVLAVGNDVGAPGAFQAIDQLIASYVVQLSLPNGSVAITGPGGNLVYTRSFTNTAWYDQFYPGGFEGNISSPCSIFRWGSVTKSVVAAATLSAVADGTLSLRDRVFHPEGRDGRRSWEHLFRVDLPFDPLAAAPLEAALNAWMASLPADIEIRHLLSHTAGWSEGRSNARIPCRAGSNTKDFDLVAARLFRQPLPPSQAQFLQANLLPTEDSIGLQLQTGRVTPSGRSYCYSNFGYALLGAILAEAHGESLQQVLARRVFRPVGMSFASLTSSDRADRRAGEVEYFATVDPRRLRESPIETDGWDRREASHIASNATGYPGPTDPLGA